MYLLRNIDEYLNWYSELSKHNEKLIQQIIDNYARLDTATEAERFELSSKIFHDEFDLTDTNYYLPDESSWKLLAFERWMVGEKVHDDYLNLEKRIAIESGQLAEAEFNKIASRVYESPFYSHVLAGNPLPVSLFEVESENEFNNGWETFINWIVDVDYSNWLYKRIQAQKETNFGQDVTVPAAPERRPRLQWNANVNLLHTLIYDLFEAKIIAAFKAKDHGDGKAEVVRMFLENFVDKQGKPLSESSFLQALKPEEVGRRAKRGKIDISQVLLAAKRTKKH